MNRLGIIAFFTIGPFALGAVVLLLLVAGAVKLWSKDEQGLAKLAVDAAITIGAGALVIIAIVAFAIQ